MQYISAKQTKYGITFVLDICDAITVYCLGFKMYSGWEIKQWLSSLI